MSEQRIPADQTQRDAIAGDLSTSYAVEAGAGTGKTSLLTSRILSAVTNGKSTLGRIAAITFTDRAACELKMRLRIELEKRLADSGTDAVTMKRLSQALAEIDSAHASTIHSFCSELLRDRAVEAGVDPGFSVGNNVQTEILFDNEWRKWLEAELDNDKSPVRIALAAGIKIDGLKSLAVALRNNNDLSVENIPSADIAGIRQIGQEFSAKANALRAAREKICKGGPCACINRIHDAAEAASAFCQPDDCDFCGAAAQIAEIKHKSATHACKEHKGFCMQSLEALELLAEKMRAKAGHAVIASLSATLRPFLENYEQAKKKLSLLDFDDLLLKTRNMLRDNPEVREYFQRKFDFIFIDECQDTDPLQLELALYLAEDGASAQSWSGVRPKKGKLLLVGDPKQSIYRFRRADIEMYEDAKKILGEHGKQIEITENFRSAKSCVAWVNTVFADLIRKPDDGSYQPEYIPLNAYRQDENKGVLVIKAPAVHASAHAARSAESAAVAGAIKKMVDEQAEVFDKALGSMRPVGYGDFAALFRTRASFPYYESALAAQGIPFRAASGRDFFQRQEVAETIAVLRAIDRPFDALAVVTALRTSLLGASDVNLADAAPHKFNYLEEIPASSPVKEQFESLRRWHALRKTSGIANIVETVVADTRAVELSLLKSGGEQRAANLMKLLDLARTYEQSAGATFGGFVEWIQERTTAADEEDSQTGDDGDCVKLLTIHKAKGLEFPVVVLADLAGEKHERGICIADRRHERLHIKLGDIKTEGFDDAKDFEKLRSDAEAKRLLYVAATRARDKIILPMFETDRNMYLLSFLLNLPGDVRAKASAFCDTIEVAPGPAVNLTASHIAIPETPGDASEELAAREAWLANRRQAIERPAQQTEVITPSKLGKEAFDEPGPFAGVRTKAASIGSAVHAVLELVDLSDGSGIEKLAEAEAISQGVPEEAALIKTLAANALSMPALRRAANAGRVYREVPFTVKVANKIVDGVIDLAFDDGGGLVIVDYKTDNVSADDASARAEKYKLQVAAYALAAEKRFGKPPVEAALLFLRDGKEVNIKVDSGLLGLARNACG